MLHVEPHGEEACEGVDGRNVAPCCSAARTCASQGGEAHWLGHELADLMPLVGSYSPAFRRSKSAVSFDIQSPAALRARRHSETERTTPRRLAAMRSPPVPIKPTPRVFAHRRAAASSITAIIPSRWRAWTITWVSPTPRSQLATRWSASGGATLRSHGRSAIKLEARSSPGLFTISHQTASGTKRSSESSFPFARVRRGCKAEQNSAESRGVRTARAQGDCTVGAVRPPAASQALCSPVVPAIESPLRGSVLVLVL